MNNHLLADFAIEQTETLRRQLEIPEGKGTVKQRLQREIRELKAQLARECVWTQEENDGPRAACDPGVFFTDDIDEYGPYCQMCGGKIVNKEQNNQ